MHSSASPTIQQSCSSTSSLSSYSCVKNERSISNRICLLCEIPVDTGGIHRPVTDACGHTICFQCFKTTMLKATGCSLCQKEEELNSQLSDQYCDSVKTFDDKCNDSDTGFETYNHVSSIDDDDDDEKCHKVVWISADVHDNGPEYR
ncbi:unnamed protein product [Rotaria sp. Silwood2]|nr:unnamed protein product [Rotaria sp. Silwood2]